MRKPAGHIVWLLLAGSLAIFLGLPMMSTATEALPTLTLEQPVHFTASDSSDVMADAGTYTVGTLVGSRLRLNAEGRAPLFIEAQATTHSEELKSPLAVTIAGEDADVLHVVLLLPNGQALDATGTISGARPRGVNSALLSAAQIHMAVLQQGPVIRNQTPATSFSRIDYLGNYPSHRSPGWSNELQGLAHDLQNWFITQKDTLWKFPVTHDLNRAVSKAAPPPGVRWSGIPASLKQAGYDHFGDLDQYGGFLFIPLEGSQKPRIAVFRTYDLSFVGSFVLTGRTQAGWCALRLESDGLYLYMSNNVIDGANPIFRYRVDLRQLHANPANTAGAFQFVNSVALYQGSTSLNIKPYLQGGEFSPDGSHLFLINGKASDFNAKDGGIWVFRGAPFQFVTKSTDQSNAGSFIYEFHPGWSKYEEPEGLTFWELDGGQAPGLPGGQLHVILLDNDSRGDEIFIKHYRLVR
ncbi:MAG: hypothetical protein E8D45_13580 [Nitrospira sp.]|nr:MAG: hypothetical protein E8D45_13580 [Nitrospira sp.]